MKVFVSFCIIFMCLSSFSYAENWEDATDGLWGGELLSIADDSGVMYVGTSRGLFKKEPGENQWIPILKIGGQYKSVNHVHVEGGKIMYAATGNGLYESVDFGSTWKQIFSGMGDENYCTWVGAHNGELYVGTLGGLFKRDASKSWKKANGRLGKGRVSSVDISQENENVYAISDNELYQIKKNFADYKKIFTSNSAEYFAEYNSEDNTAEEVLGEVSFLLNSIKAGEKALYLSTSKGLFTSYDDGDSWTRFSQTGLLARGINYVLVEEEPRVRFFCGTKKGVFEYRDNRQTWVIIDGGMESTNVTQILFDGSRIWALSKNRVYFMKPETSGNVVMQEILLEFKIEPTVNQTMQMAIEYAEVYPEKIAKWREAAKYKALFPKVTLGIDQSSSDTYEIYTSSTKQYWIYGPKDATEGWDVSFTWDLSDLIWNDAQTSIDVRSKLMVQLRDDIVDEVTRAYFERRRLQVERRINPPKAMKDKMKKQLRFQELTANLDGLTGGRFSGACEKKVN